jgi:RNA polymerase sigma-70 factor (ECF subfamily)
MSDEELLIALSEGVNSALDQLFTRHGGRVLNYCAKRGLSPEQAQDLTQVVFLQIFRKKHLYDPKHPALAWLYVITKSELKDYRARESRHAGASLDSLSQIGVLDPISFEDADQVQALLKDLSPGEQEALKLRYIEDLEYPEIARKLNKSESNVRQIISRSLRFLKGKHGSKP